MFGFKDYTASLVLLRMALFEASCVYIRVFRCFFHFCEGDSATEPAGGFGPRLFQQHLSMWVSFLVSSVLSFYLLG